MNILVTCIECMQTKGVDLFSPFTIPYFEERTASAECKNGHQIFIVLKSQKFEVLMESGGNALLADFTLEACASYAAALERFFEFSSKVMLMHLNMNMNNDIYSGLFKEMSRQSERQLGAFLVLHGLVFGIAYKPNQKLVEFRNSVIHKGKIPSPKEARDFCGLVYAEIMKVSELLKVHCNDKITKVLQDDFISRLPPDHENKNVFSSYTTSVFSIKSDNNKFDFDSALENHSSFMNATKKMADEFSVVLKQMMDCRPEIRELIDSIRPKSNRSDE